MKTNTIGRLTCPICNEPSQDLRVDKNGKLYMYCDNLCVVKFNGKMSKKYLSVLESGKSIQLEKIGVITSLKPKKENKQDEQLQWEQSRKRIDINGRTDGQPDGVRADDKHSGGFWRGMFADDDE